MAEMLRLEGVKKMIAELKRRGVVTAQEFARNVRRAGLFLQRESQLIVPVDTGNLKNSAFTRKAGGRGWKVIVVVGYTAAYAIFVHENLEARHKEGKEAKFLEKPLREKRDRILGIMAGDR